MRDVAGDGRGRCLKPQEMTLHSAFYFSAISVNHCAPGNAAVLKGCKWYSANALLAPETQEALLGLNRRCMVLRSCHDKPLDSSSLSPWGGNMYSSNSLYPLSAT